ncbi:Fe-S cluster assembly protein SufD [Propionibacterium cyclohexanicum]|uniref:Fe-S cluster assembly protein SufD n=1 Tax=Propionibacterium cyclohexanicum TaxID=64702 RepID=A0A1H9PND4_9ACTN|nr:Fe-S cluster assembly protein SufD [Propionibacterium cyclohexanicum]
MAQPVDSGAEAVAAAVETPASHLHPKVSWDLEDHPLPKGREEVWRFTPVRKLTRLLSGEPTDHGFEVIAALPAQVSLGTISEARARVLSVEPPADRSAAIACHNTRQASVLDIPAGLELDEPVELTFRGTGVDERIYEHLIVNVGRAARVKLVFRYEGSTASAGKIDVRVGEGAQLDFVTLSDWAPDALRAAQHSVRVGRDAHVRTVQASLGGAVTRLIERATFEGSGGQLEQFGLYFVDGARHVEHRLFIDHNEPHTRSEVDYRGAVQGEGSHSVWVGDVLIRKQAEGINTYEANKNLLLTPGARADSIPNLEIETGNIEGAGHSSTTGRFDDEQLFYLRSRGIPEDEARRLVVQGFFVDIIRRIQVPDVEERLMAAVDRELDVIAPEIGDPR